VSTVRGLPHRHPWLRTLVLLLALLVPVAPAQAHSEHVVAGEIVEYDVLDTALRPPARAAHRTAVPLRPAPRPRAAPEVPEDRPRPAPPGPSYTSRTLRCVVLRC